MAIAQLVAGLLGALVGAVLSHWWAAKRDKDRDHRLDNQEHQKWVRNLRYETHLDFLTEFERKYHLVSQRQDEDPSFSEPPDDYLVDLYRKLNAMRLVATEGPVDRASKALEAFQQFCFQGGQWEQVDFNIDLYLCSIRDELNLPPVKLMGE